MVKLLILKNIYCQITLAKEYLVYCMLFAKDKNSNILTILTFSEEISKPNLTLQVHRDHPIIPLSIHSGSPSFFLLFFFSLSLCSPLPNLSSLTYYVRCLFSVSPYKMGQGSLLCSLMQLVLTLILAHSKYLLKSKCLCNCVKRDKWHFLSHSYVPGTVLSPGFSSVFSFNTHKYPHEVDIELETTTVPFQRQVDRGSVS